MEVLRQAVRPTPTGHDPALKIVFPRLSALRDEPPQKDHQ
jgi:hypothetical protein